MNIDLTPSQALLMFGLVARHGDCKQAELMPAPKKADREALAAAKLVKVETVARNYHITLTDAGWSWTGNHLSAELPPAYGALRDLLARLGEHLTRSNETLADFIGSKPEDAAARAKRKIVDGDKRPADEKKRVTAKKAGEKKKVPARPKSLARPKAPTAAALRKRIGEAYLEITGGKKNESVKLSQLRVKLSDLDRTAVDAALARILQGDKKASLMRHDDPRQIDKADADAAFSPAGEPFHVLWISS